jgi:hypothetical protein
MGLPVSRVSKADRRLHRGRIEVQELVLKPVQNAGNGHLLVLAVHQQVSDW